MGRGLPQMPCLATPSNSSTMSTTISSHSSSVSRMSSPQAQSIVDGHASVTEVSGIITQCTYVWVYTFDLLASLASHSPSHFLSSWQLFLADPLATENAIRHMGQELILETDSRQAHTTTALAGVAESGWSISILSLVRCCGYSC